MSSRAHFLTVLCRATSAVLLLALCLCVPVARTQTLTPSESAHVTPSSKGTLDSQAPVAKPDPKKAREAYRQGTRAEHEEDWETAYGAYADAVKWAPSERDYVIRREVVKGHLVQMKIDLAE